MSQFKVAGGFTYAGVNGTSNRLWKIDRNNFMPRIGLAYSFDSKTVLRAGFGYFYDQLGIRSGMSASSATARARHTAPRWTVA